MNMDCEEAEMTRGNTTGEESFLHIHICNYYRGEDCPRVDFMNRCQRDRGYFGYYQE